MKWKYFQGLIFIPEIKNCHCDRLQQHNDKMRSLWSQHLHQWQYSRVVTTTSRVTSDDKVGIMTTLGFQSNFRWDIRQSNTKHLICTIFWLQHIMIHHREVGTLWYIIMKSASCPPVFSGPGKQQLPAVEYRKLATCLLLGMSKVMCPPGWEAYMQ